MKSFLHTVINRKRIHLDFAATTPVASEVIRAMNPFWSKLFFNPSASYKAGQDAKKIIKKARTSIGTFFGVKESEIIFTQGGTESINLALIGYIKHIKKTESFKPHIIVSAIEHPAVSECVEYIKTLDVDVDIIPVFENGSIDTQAFEKLLTERTVLVSVIGASNETGVIQPIHKVASIVKKFKNAYNRTQTQYPFVHSDISQMVLTQDVSISKLGTDMLTVDGSKMYAPKMNGLLVRKQYVELEPLMYGGGQEFGLRSGTENVAGITGLDKAIELIKKRKQKDNKHFLKLKEFFIQELSKSGIEFEINGNGEILPNILNVCISGLNSDFAVIQMDEYGVNCAAMTSCAGSKGLLKSEILEAMGKENCSASSLRFSFGRTTTRDEIKKSVKIILKIAQLQKVV
jgi:cysteine desulfurase